MADRRHGPTFFWELFWKAIYGERRKGERRSRVNPIVYGCAGNCNQGRRACDCRNKDQE